MLLRAKSGLMTRALPSLREVFVLSLFICTYTTATFDRMDCSLLLSFDRNAAMHSGLEIRLRNWLV